MSQRAFLLAILALAPGAAAAPPPARNPPPPGSGPVAAVAGAEFAAGGLHRLLFGSGYRALWTRPAEFPVLDLARHKGGLKPVRRVGGQQTLGLALSGGDGQSYTFRAVLKDPSAALPPALRGSYAAELVRDQSAAAHPGAAAVVAVLAEAAGILQSAPTLVVMPDDPALGEFRAAFAGQVGTLEVFPRPGFAGSSEIIDAVELARRLDEGSPDSRIDAREYLRARLLDLLVGDWDRHRGQWRWGRLPGREALVPIPEDRDQAFVRFEGLALTLARLSHPQLVRYGPGYPTMNGIAFNGREQDRRLLAGLERAEYEKLAKEIQQRLTGEVLERAIGTLPEAWRGASAERLRKDLKARLQALPAAADQFYQHLAREVDITLSERGETVEVEHLEGGELEVTARPSGEGPLLYQRRLRRADTREVRIALRGGDDQVSVKGSGSGIVVRVIAGGGSDVIDDGQGGRTRVYDAGATTRVLPGRATRVSRKPWLVPPPDPQAPWIPARDWGAQNRFLPWLFVSPELGVLGGANYRHTRWGFRHDPYLARHDWSAGYATGQGDGMAGWEGEFRPENSSRYLNIAARYSGIDLMRFYGLGNSTEELGDKTFHRVLQRQLSFAPSLGTGLAGRGHASFGPTLEYHATDLEESPFLTQARPYGSGRFGQVGVQGELFLDSRPAGRPAPDGIRLSARGSWYPAAWDVRKSFGDARAEAEARLGEGRRIGLRLRAGAHQVWGDYPFHKAAYLGGSDTVRGFERQRFAGDAAVWAGSELRLRVGKVDFPVPTDFGLAGFVDSGRVFLDGETSRKWHAGYGGGLWVAPLSRANSLTLLVARSRERTALYFSASLAF